MEITQLPPEIQFELLLDLTWQEIINYCQTNKRALDLCETEAFWKIKERHQFGTSYFDLVNGKTPSLKYKSLEKILITGDLNLAIEEGQHKLLPAIWSSDIYLSSTVVYFSLTKGNLELIDILKELQGKDFHLFLIRVYKTAIEFSNISLTYRLMPYLDMRYTDLLRDYLEMSGDNRFGIYQKLIDQGLENGEEDIAQDMANILLEMEEDSLLRELMEHYLDHIDTVALFRQALTKCPIANYLSNFVHVSTI